MQASRNTIGIILALARAAGVSRAQLIEMARTAEHWEQMPDLGYLTSAGAQQLIRDLEAIPETRRQFRQIEARILEAHQVRI